MAQRIPPCAGPLQGEVERLLDTLATHHFASAAAIRLDNATPIQDASGTIIAAGQAILHQ